MCARHPRGFRRLARFVRRVSEVLPELRDPVYAHRLFVCRTRIMAESPCQGKTDSTYGLINNITTSAAFDSVAGPRKKHRRAIISSWVTARHDLLGEHRPVQLHHRENVGRADTKQQHAVGPLQRAHRQPMSFQCQPRSASRGHRVDGIEDRIFRGVERTKPHIRRRPDRGLNPV
jgi:hypothetical protein